MARASPTASSRRASGLRADRARRGARAKSNRGRRPAFAYAPRPPPRVCRGGPRSEVAQWRLNVGRAPSSTASNMVIGARRHDGRDRVLVDELRMAVAPQQHAEIVEPGHEALQFDAVDEKNRHRSLGLANVIEERVLQVLRLFAWHEFGSHFGLGRLSRPFRCFGSTRLASASSSAEPIAFPRAIAPSARRRSAESSSQCASATSWKLRRSARVIGPGRPSPIVPPVDGDDRHGDRRRAGKERFARAIGLLAAKKGVPGPRIPRRAATSSKVERVTPRRIAWSACRVTRRRPRRRSRRWSRRPR